MRNYTVYMHHAAGFTNVHKVSAQNKTAAEATVRAMYPAIVVRKVLVATRA